MYVSRYRWPWSLWWTLKCCCKMSLSTECVRVLCVLSKAASVNCRWQVLHSLAGDKTGKLMSGSAKHFMFPWKLFVCHFWVVCMSGVLIVPLSRIISPISRIMVNCPHNVFMFNDLRGGRGTLWSLWGLSSIFAWRPIRGQMADRPIRGLLCNKCLGNLK